MKISRTVLETSDQSNLAAEFNPYQNDAEIVYLYKCYPDEFAYWEEREQAKLTKFAHMTRNLGVKGKLTLRQTLINALEKFGHWSADELEAYRFSHGHCVASKYCVAFYNLLWQTMGLPD